MRNFETRSVSFLFYGKEHFLFFSFFRCKAGDSPEQGSGFSLNQFQTLVLKLEAF
jgi:hypothetical protein